MSNTDRQKSKKADYNREYWQKNKEKLRIYKKDYDIRNKEKQREVQKLWKIKNADKVRRYFAEYKKNNGDLMKQRAFKYKLKHLYKMSVEQFDQMKVSQDNKCEICSAEFIAGAKIHIDHCHSTGIVRGLLCGNCNMGIGNFKDDPSLFFSAVAYLKKNEIKEQNRYVG